MCDSAPSSAHESTHDLAHNSPYDSTHKSAHDSTHTQEHNPFRICGIDEAGRGCVGGSLFVCGVILGESFPKKLLSQLQDSKKLTQKTRDTLAPQIKQHARFHLVSKTAQEIDSRGLSLCLKESLQEILAHLKAPYYLFDGNCSFGIPALHTLIKGDSKVAAISAASILAKNAKDAESLELDSRYPQYGFKSHKGYGTQAHIEAILEFGYCQEHRKTYRFKKLTQTTKTRSLF